MDTDDFPSDFDIVILGTGLTETIAAAAFSRIGLKVLHLDRNNYYGGSFANFNLQGIEEWKKKMEELEENGSSDAQEVTDEVKKESGEENSVFPLPCERAQAQRVSIKFLARERTEEEKAAAEASRLKKLSSLRPFNPTDFTLEESSTREEAPNQVTDSKSPANSENIPDSEKSPNSESLDTTSNVENESSSELTKNLSTDENITESDVSKIVEEEEKNEKSNKARETVEQEEQKETEKTDEPKNAADKDFSPKKDQVEWTKDALDEEWRKFCFDLSPKVLYCSGDLVELLIQSDVARYCEFRTVSRVLTLLNNSLQQVPCSRADVFSSKIVSLIEKRLMMKFLQFAADYESHPEEYSEFIGKPFVDFLKSKKLTANVQHFVLHAIAMVSEEDSTEKGLKNTQTFLRSLGRYGNTAFLFSLYGSGELPQAFSRLSAVFGGVYCLMMSASHIMADKENKCCGIISTQGKKINCKYLVAEASYLPPSFVQYPTHRKTSRAIFITDKSICETKDPELSLLNFICKDKQAPPVSVMELPPSACVCPKGLYVVHLTREGGSDDPEKDFDEVKQKLFASESDTDSNESPKILWSCFFSLMDSSQASLTQEAVSNVFVTSGGGDASIDMEKCVSEAKQIFLAVCPDEEFLPKPPNPEDIIYVDDEEATTTGGPGEFDSAEANEEKDEEIDKSGKGGDGLEEQEKKSVESSPDERNEQIQGEEKQENDGELS